MDSELAPAWEVYVLGYIPNSCRMSDQRIRVARPSDAIAWEIRQALAATGLQPSHGAAVQRIVVMAVRRCLGHEDLRPGEASTEAAQVHRGWIGGLLLGESVSQVLYRWALFDGASRATTLTQVT
ncbi:unnamed protein product [Polarella glacialis]|nr:unnamed protein product [Polarella glacialis]